MRKNIVAGNWKMNTTLPEGIKLAEEVNAALAGEAPKCDVVICVPFTHLASINNVIDKNKLGLGAENCADHRSGAYTGEVSAPMVASTARPPRLYAKKCASLLTTISPLSSALAKCLSSVKTAAISKS